MSNRWKKPPVPHRGLIFHRPVRGSFMSELSNESVCLLILSLCFAEVAVGSWPFRGHECRTHTRLSLCVIWVGHFKEEYESYLVLKVLHVCLSVFHRLSKPILCSYLLHEQLFSMRSQRALFGLLFVNRYTLNKCCY